MVPECGVDAEPPLSWVTGFGMPAWAGHQIHVALPVNKLLDSGSPKDIPYPRVHFNSSLMAELFPSFAKG